MFNYTTDRSQSSAKWYKPGIITGSLEILILQSPSCIIDALLFLCTAIIKRLTTRTNWYTALHSDRNSIAYRAKPLVKQAATGVAYTS